MITYTLQIFLKNTGVEKHQSVLAWFLLVPVLSRYCKPYNQNLWHWIGGQWKKHSSSFMEGKKDQRSRTHTYKGSEVSTGLDWTGLVFGGWEMRGVASFFLFLSAWTFSFDEVNAIIYEIKCHSDRWD